MAGYSPDTTHKSEGSGSAQVMAAIDLNVVGREEVVRVPVAVSRGQDRRPLAPSIDSQAEIMAGSPSASSVNDILHEALHQAPGSIGIPLVMIALRQADHGSIADVLLSSRLRGCMTATIGEQPCSQGRCGGHGSFRALAVLGSLASARIAGGGR